MKRQTKSAFLWIIKVLEKHKIPYRVSGGFAAKVYGTERELVDIDIDIHDKDVDKILPFVKKYIIAGPKRYKDRQWNLYSMSLRYKGQEIDLCGTDSVKIFDKRKKKWVKLKTNFSKTTKKKIFGFFTKSKLTYASIGKIRNSHCIK